MASFSASERQQSILGHVRQAGRFSIQGLIEAIDASPATVRRDIAALVEGGKLERVRGGVFWPSGHTGEATYEQRKTSAVAAKRAIALAAAERVPDKASVFLDAGSSCLALAERLADRKDLTVYTNSFALRDLLSRVEYRLVFLGGECRAVSHALVGSVTESQIADLRPEIAFLGATAVDPKRGCFTTEPSEAGVKRSVLRVARQAYLLADAGKANAAASVRFALWSAFDGWITNASLSAQKARQYPVSVTRARGSA